jgi:hypothetical protein
VSQATTAPVAVAMGAGEPRHSLAIPITECVLRAAKEARCFRGQTEYAKLTGIGVLGNVGKNLRRNLENAHIALTGISELMRDSRSAVWAKHEISLAERMSLVSETKYTFALRAGLFSDDGRLHPRRPHRRALWERGDHPAQTLHVAVTRCTHAAWYFRTAR